MDSSLIPGKNKLQMFDWNQFQLLQILAIKDTNLQFRGCPQ